MKKSGIVNVDVQIVKRDTQIDDLKSKMPIEDDLSDIEYLKEQIIRSCRGNDFLEINKRTQDYKDVLISELRKARDDYHYPDYFSEKIESLKNYENKKKWYSKSRY